MWTGSNLVSSLCDPCYYWVFHAGTATGGTIYEQKHNLIINIPLSTNGTCNIL